jgi:hypothetical protein
VGEVINGGIRLLGINGGIRWLIINEGDLREEDKEEGEDLEKDHYLCLRISELQKRERRRKLEEWFWGALTGHWCCWEFWAWGSGNRKDFWS